MAFPTNANLVQAFAGAMYGVQIGSVTMAQVNNDIIANGGLNKALNGYYTASFGGVATATVAATVSANLGLTGDALNEGRAYITAQLNAAAPSARGEVIANILNLFSGLASDAKFGAAATAWNTKVDAAAAYTAATDVAIGTVVSTSRVFALTTGADAGTSFTGGASDDTFNATIGTNGTTANGTTLNPGDNLNGGAGKDALALSIAGTNTAAITTASVTLAGIEEISVSNFQTDDAFDNTINLATATGVSKISLSSSAASGDTFFTAVRSLVTAEMGNGAGDLGVTYVDTVIAGTTDVQTLNLAGQTAGTFTVAPTATGVVETISIASGTSANTVAVTSAGTTTINASGDQNLTLTEGMTDTITRVNASAMTGNFAFTTNDATAISVTGGAGNDTITLGTTFAATDSVDGGAGNDTLSVAAAITQATLANVSNVETLTVTGGNSVTLAANVSPTTFTVSDATASVVTLNTGYTNATTVNLGVTDSVVNSANVALTANVTAANAISGAGISITGGTGVDALNITATGAAAFTLANVTLLDRITAVDGGDTAATAGADISITVGAAYATALTVDASALDAGTVTGTTMNADFENLTFDASLQSTAATVLNVTGGAGADTITGGAGNDIITGGAGNDSINGSVGGNDSISGGDGVDTINMGAALTSADTIDGGAGNDILTVTSLTATGLTNVTNIETLSLSGAASTASLSANLSFTTVDMDTVDNTAQTLTLAAGYTNATTVLVDAGDRVTNTANAVLNVNVNAANIATASGTVITGGTANDTLNIKADTNAGAATTLTGLVTLVDRITVVDGGDTVALAGSDLSITTGAYATSLTIDGSALDVGTLTGTTPNNDYENLTVDASGITTATVVLNATGGGGRDTITGGAGNDIIATGGENDSINGGSGGNDSITAGDGNDTINMAGALTYQDSIDGGVGTDVLRVSAAVADVDFTNVKLVETLTVDGNVSATLGTIAQAAGIVTVNAFTTASAINASTYTSAIRMNASATNVTETMTGGSGDDTFNFATSGTLTGADVIAGGTGNDTILVGNAAAGAVTAAVDFDNATAIEKITLGSASGNAASTAETIGLTIDALTLTTAQTVIIDASVITDSNDAVTITNSASTTTTKFNILGGAGNDVLAGSNAADTIEGGSGNDSITGNTGADVLTGGAGSDAFIYALTASTQAATDRITDFASGTDKIQITAATVAANATVDYSSKGTAANAVDAMGLLSSKVGEYYFNTTTGTMVLDTDGNGLLQSTDFAIGLTGLTAIGALDVEVTITDAAGAESITTGSGNDTVNMTDTTANKADSINAGAGDDTINTVRASLNDTTSDTIVGGAGNDTLNIGGTAGTIAVFGTDAALATVENININTAGSTLDLSAQTEAFNVTMVSTASTAGVTLGSAAHTVTGGSGADTVTVGTRAILLAAASINGGAGTDSIVVGAASTAFVDSDFTKIASVESLTLTGTSSIVLGANATAAGIATVVTGTTATSITSTQTALAVTSTSLATTEVLTLLGSANYTVTSTTTTHDRITATGSTGTLSATFGDAGSNGITVATGSGNTTIVGGGAGDTITVTGLATAAQTFTGSVSKFAITAGAGAQTITTGAAVDTITGGTGADVINVGSGTGDRINLAAGSGAGGGDSGTYTATAVNSVSTTNFDKITGMGTGDIISFAAASYSGNAGAASGLIANAVTGTTLASGTLTLANNSLHLIRGTYDAVAQTFVGAAAGLDGLVIYDADAGATAAYEAVVLVGNTLAGNGTGVGGDAGIYTLQ
jgi:Ca2+-binding RTX toxin-like protein